MKAFIKFIIFISSICALTENGETNNYFLTTSCIIMIIWSIYSLIKSGINNLCTEDAHNYSYNNKNNNNNNNKYINTYRPYSRVTSKETIKKITKNLKTNTNTKIVTNDCDITKNENNMMLSTETSPTRTLSLLPLRDILKQDYERKYPLTEETFVSDSSIIPIVGEKVTPVVNTIIPIVEEVKIVEETKKRKEVSIILIQNEDKLSVNKIAAYKAIIEAYKTKNISQSMIYTLLQSITAIDVFSDAITIYASKLPLYSSKTITEEELITSMKKSLHDDNIEITIVERKDITIADYYIKNSYF